MQLIYSECSWCHFAFKPATSFGVTYTLQDIRQPIGTFCPEEFCSSQKKQKKPHTQDIIACEIQASKT